MDISPDLAAALALLAEALDDDTGADIAASLRRLAADAAAAVPSYLGLTVTQRDITPPATGPPATGPPSTAPPSNAPPFTITAMESGARADAIRSSLLLPIPGGGRPSLALILYGARPGAFVHLAADLARVLGRPLDDFAVDQHLRPPPASEAGRSLHVLSVINQAIGVLIGRGHSLQEAERELDARAGRAGHSRYDAARGVLHNLGAGAADGSPEVW